ncbi:MAG: LCP family protein, partial [Spirochaetaceae bacterium]|nr:LCP family protein [Spirochaetaceae bacterium]
ETNMVRAAGAIDGVKNILGTSPVQWDWGLEEQNDTGDEEGLQKLEELDMFYSAVDLLEDTQRQYQANEDFINYLDSSGISADLEALGLQMNLNGPSSCTVKRGDRELFRLLWQDGLIAQGPDDSQVINPESSALTAWAKELLQEMEDNWQRHDVLTQQLRGVLAIPSVVSLVEEKNLKPRFFTGEQGIELAIRLIDYSEVERITTDKEQGALIFQGKAYKEFDLFTQELVSYLEELDQRTEIMKTDDQAAELVSQALNDTVFMEYLQSKGYEIAREPQLHIDDHGTKSDYLHWDITKDEQRIGSIALLKTFGELYLLDGDDIPIQSFRGFTEDHRVLGDSSYEYSDDFEVLSDLYSSRSSQTYLMIGTHEKNADTMILLHGDLETGITHMISIPRDLWFNNRKVNSVYRYYGPEELVKELSKLTGLEINDYISVDMYAFIEIINIMGGVDLVLDEALIDPTYKIKENGQWSTLHYPAGPVHLDGLGALRVARSRHSTNDFDRAKRQQRVIEAMKEKATGMGLNDMDKLFQFISAAREYTESSMSPSAMLRAFLKFKDTEIVTGNVIDNTNILYTSYSNLYELSEEERQSAMEDPEFNKGAWIVLPRNNDWNLIKWFIRQIIDPQ